MWFNDERKYQEKGAYHDDTKNRLPPCMVKD